MLCSFEEFDDGAHAARAGGKGKVLAGLFQAGYPVPDGFIIFPEALGDAGVDPACWAAITEHYRRLASDGARVAVRSSALAEDSRTASFAGAFETVLDVESEAQLRDAIATVHASKDNERVQTYTEERRLSGEHAMAIVVQRMVAADYAGVLFTVDPVSGDNKMVGSLVEGLGEALVSGEDTGEGFSLDVATGEVTAPERFSPYCDELFELARRIVERQGGPQDIEWAVAGGKVYILQSRPITTIANNYEVWNDSLKGDYLWTNTNWGEAIPDVMSPCLWTTLASMVPTPSKDDMPALANIGGRIYANLSMSASFAAKFGQAPRTLFDNAKHAFGIIPEHITVPLVKLSWWQVISFSASMVWMQLVLLWKARNHMHWIANDCESWCEQTKRRIVELSAPAELTAMSDEFNGILERNGFHLVRVTNTYMNHHAKLRELLKTHLDDEAVETLLSGLGGNSHLASMEPLFAIEEVIEGKLSREDFARRFGHRGPHELEVSIPRVGEDPEWIDRLVEQSRAQYGELGRLMEDQRAARDVVLERLRSEKPKAYKKIVKLRRATAALARQREVVRSAVIRCVWVSRTLLLQTGKVHGLGDDIFFLEVAEIAQLEHTDVDTYAGRIARRKESHRIYSALPPLPNLISGPFEPLQWAKDPNRRVDYYDSHVSRSADDSRLITGLPGATGVVEGTVRVLHSYDQSHELQKGEILVASVTNVGWTPIFPRAAAVITDIGAPVSHAAIVARELGIPAVVGTGNATARLKTGDRVKVIGHQGIVEILDAE